MRPVVERIPHGIRHRLGPFLEFLPGRPVTCNIFFRDSVTAHCAPLVVVASEPDFGKVRKLVVFGDHLGNKMAVVIDYRHLLRALVVQLAGGVVGEHEVFVRELLHISSIRYCTL